MTTSLYIALKAINFVSETHFSTGITSIRVLIACGTTDKLQTVSAQNTALGLINDDYFIQWFGAIMLPSDVLIQITDIHMNTSTGWGVWIPGAMIKSMSISKHVRPWLLIGWQHSR